MFRNTSSLLDDVESANLDAPLPRLLPSPIPYPVASYREPHLGFTGA